MSVFTTTLVKYCPILDNLQVTLPVISVIQLLHVDHACFLVMMLILRYILSMKKKVLGPSPPCTDTGDNKHLHGYLRILL